jgi:peptidoglycan/LPS O-acetylase OafA/YrhL
MPQQRIAGLDGIRAIAVLMVFASHADNVARDLQFGSIGVWAFFVLSGFLIVRILSRQRLEIEAGETNFATELSTFFKRRTLRIFPIYYLVLGCAALSTLLGTVWHYSGAPWPYYWTYMTNIYIQTSGALLGSFSHLWSLAIEEQFYVIAAPLFLITPARFAVHLCGMFIFVGLARGMALADAPATTFHFDSIFNFYMLGLGGLAGLLASRINRVQASAGLALCLTAFLALLAIDYTINTDINQGIFLFPIFAASLYIYIFRNQSSIIVRMLDLSPLRGLGRVSYGFYLYHNFWKLDLIRAAFGVSFEPSNWLRITLEFSITLALAVLSWIAIERPLLALQGKPGHRRELSQVA